MAHSGSSSKRKSSHKKSSKISSQVSRKKKIRKNKSKKRRGGDDSDSYSDDESMSSMSVSYSSSDDYKSRKGRSRVRTSVKKSKKKIARIRSSSPEGSKDSTRLRKRKRSKKEGDSKLKKKSRKKRTKRHDSISSRSSDGEESDFERLRGRSSDKKGKGDSGKSKSETKKRKNRSMSVERDNYDTENVVGEINTQRLRSIITVTKEPREREEDEPEKDVHTEEIVYDHDDYPSCRSNDSNDGGNKRELVDQPYVESEKRVRVENVTEEEDLTLNNASNESVAYDGLIAYPDRFRTNSPETEQESEAPAAFAGSVHDGDDMELILRQKALENLKRFRGGLKINPETHGDLENKSDVNAECVQSRSPKKEAEVPMLRMEPFRPKPAEGKIAAGRSSQTESEAAKKSVVHPPDKVVPLVRPKDKDHAAPSAVSNKSESNRSTMRHELLGTGSTPKQAVQITKDAEIRMLQSESFRYDPSEGKIPGGRFSRTESEAAKSSVVYPPDKAVPSVTVKNKDHAPPADSNKSESNRSTMRPESLGTGSTPRKIIPITKSTVNKSVAETSQTVVTRSDNNSQTAAAEPPSEDHNSSRERQDEPKDSSQFEQKTMTVMRGGELVQVNYKVYIPKKAPALSRRKLHR